MKYGIKIENVSKTFVTKRVKLWFKDFNNDTHQRGNVKYEYKKCGLLKQRKKYTYALDNVSLDVEDGEIIGLLGPNAAGKTTLAKIVSTLILPDTGSVKVNGYDVVKETTRVRLSLGLVTSGERSLYWKLTPYQNLRFFGNLYGMNSNETDKRAIELLETFDLLDKKDDLVQNLSTGYKMKTAFARSLMHDPEVLILDEYNRGLDPQASLELRKYIKNTLQGEQGKTILLMTHAMDVAQSLADRIVLIDEGKIVAKGTTSELISSIADTQTIEIEFSGNIEKRIISALSTYGTIESNPDHTIVWIKTKNNPHLVYEVLDFLHTKSIAIKRFSLQQPNLEDVFIEYTGKKLQEDE